MSSPNPSLPFLPPTLPLLPLATPQLLFPFLSVTIQLKEDEIALILKAVGENGHLDTPSPDSRANTKGAKEDDKPEDGVWEGKKVLAKGERMVAVVPVLEIERRIGRWATAARIKSITVTTSSSSSSTGIAGRRSQGALNESRYTLTLEGIARIRLPSRLPPVLSLLPPIPLTRSSFALPLPLLHPIDAGTYTSAQLLGLARPLLGGAILSGTQLRGSKSTDVQAASAVLQEVESRLSSVPVGLLADVLAVMLGMDFEVKVDMLGLVGVEERCERLERALGDILSRRGFAASSTSPSSSRALITLKQSDNPPTTRSARRAGPASAVTGPAGQPSQTPIPEDLQPLADLLFTRSAEIPAQTQAVISREIVRLTKIQPQSAEYGVGKTYLELLLALPWNKVSPDEGIREGESIGESLDRVKRELEEGHEGLEGVKRRVLEYLAVYRLKKRNFEQAQVQAAPAAPTAESITSTESVNGSIDASTASDLLELIPESDRHALSAPPTPSTPNSTPAQFRDKGPILLLVGPPGVGKTSIARSLASAMGRTLHRISLGGVRDEAEIRGHRRTYVGALPGLLVSALKRTGVSNPLILLDELDKVSASSHRGDPAAALLEALDPEQNGAFHDHYLGDVTVDLSRVVFVATANETDSIPPALLDRCELIECKGYSEDEKVRIAERFLVRKQCEEAGMMGKVRVQEEALRSVVEGYTMESGVRNLERQMGKLIRAKAVESLSSPSSSSPSPSASSSASSANITITITASDVLTILGPPPYLPEPPSTSPAPGIVHGLGYRGSGMGSVLVLEAILVPAHTAGSGGKLRLTGSLGEVISESAELALSWVRSRMGVLGVDVGVLRDNDIHLHLPSGAVKKDGPSAGIAMAIAFVSLLTKRPVPATTAFTGEITLRGAVTAVGGIREKVLAAHRAGMTRIIMSHRNEKDTGKDLGERVKRDIKIDFVKTIEEGLEAVWGPDIWVGGAGDHAAVARL